MKARKRLSQLCCESLCGLLKTTKMNAAVASYHAVQILIFLLSNSLSSYCIRFFQKKFTHKQLTKKKKICLLTRSRIFSGSKGKQSCLENCPREQKYFAHLFLLIKNRDQRSLEDFFFAVTFFIFRRVSPKITKRKDAPTNKFFLFFFLALSRKLFLPLPASDFSLADNFISLSLVTINANSSRDEK